MKTQIELTFGAGAGGGRVASIFSLMTAASSAPQSMMTKAEEIQSRKKMINVRVPWRSLFSTIPTAEKWRT
jgi:hypothetical protein